MDEDKLKMQIAVLSLDALFKYGLPALAKIVNNLSSKETVTEADILKLKGELDSESFFK